MAMVKCRECGKDISSGASKCPHCGKQLKRTDLLVGIFGLTLLIGCIVSSCAS